MMTLLIIQILFITFFIALFLLVLINFIGLFYTAEKKTSVTHSYFNAADDLYKTISDIQNYPQWKKEIINIDINGDSWKEYFTNSEALRYKIIHTEPGKQLIIKLESQNFPVILNRTYTIWYQDYMAFLKIEDQVKISKPYLRVFSSIFYDHTSYLRNIMQSMEFYLENKPRKSTSSFL